MARVGRKRKSGARTAKGALKRAVVWDKGCEGVQRRQALYARPASKSETEPVPGRPGKRRPRGADPSQTFDAIGRAWSAGLLGARGDELMAGARIIASQYWRVYGFATPDSLARFQPSGGVGIGDPVRDRIIEGALNAALDAVRARGHDVRRAFDQLVIDLNPDHGPAWLDRIILAKHQGRGPSEADGNMMRLALEGLHQVA